MNPLIVVRDFGPVPYGRYPSDGEYNGTSFRKLLAKELRNAIKHKEVLTVVLDGYNRYGRSFLDEAFGGLIREENFTYEELKNHLKYTHSLVAAIPLVIDERIEAAAKATQNKFGAGA